MAIFKRLRPPNVMSYFAVFASLLWFMVLSTSAQPAGYLSIDCGLSTSGFTSTIGIIWVPDDGYIGTGQIAIVPDTYGNLTGTTLGTLRYFPEIIPKNCYDLSPVIEGNPYMVRPSFYYGNYDKKNSPPTFALIIDGTVMQSPVNSENSYYEMYIVAKSSSINVCLGRSTADNAGNPFISSLELRPIPSGSSYDVVLQQGYGLYGIYSWDLGANSSETLRYPDDNYDRIWGGVQMTSNLVTTEAVVVGGVLAPSYPPALMFQTSIQDTTISFSNIAALRKYHVVMFFAEISALVTQAGDRVFDISSNSYYQGSNLLASSVDIFHLTGGQYIATEIPSPFPLTLSSSTSLVISFTASSLSTYPPLIAGIQLMLYTEDSMSNLTNSNDAKAINLIRDYYKIEGSSGDPCLPTNYAWSWITCDTNKSPPRIISILLSKAGLKGNISTDFNSLIALTEIHLDNNELTGSIPDLSSLSVLQKLDLQNNNLSGTIPASLAKLPSLTELFLQNNELQGQVPSDLLKKANDNKLNFNFEGNNIICNGSCSSPTPPSPPSPPAPKPTNHIGLIIGIVVGLILLVIIVIVMICYICKRYGGRRSTNKPQAMGAITTPTPPENKRHPHGVSRTEIFEAATTTQEFTFKQIMVATQNFTKLLGEGGFGPVYEGTLENGVIVAIKVLSQASIQGAREFLNEVGLLSRVHHRNLVRLVGYCTEQKLVLVYEYMSKGSLFDLLFGRATNTPLTWRERLAIMIDAAHGLEYLHHGCNSLIIHRDVKSSNILLTNKLEAKMSDFGISRLTSNDNDNIATSLVGSMGYLDPEYASTFRLTEKIDIYSFGVVLFETICGQPPVIRKKPASQEIHLVEWVRPSYEGGSIEEVVDRSFGNAYNVYSVWKVAEVAMACVQFEGAKRPSMSEVCADLKEAMKLETDTNLEPTRDAFPAPTRVFSLTHVQAR